MHLIVGVNERVRDGIHVYDVTINKKTYIARLDFSYYNKGLYDAWGRLEPIADAMEVDNKGIIIEQECGDYDALIIRFVTRLIAYCEEFQADYMNPQVIQGSDNIKDLELLGVEASTQIREMIVDLWDPIENPIAIR